MIRFGYLEDLGLAVAGCSERADGDCRAVDPADAEESLRNRSGILRGCGLYGSHLAVVRQVHGAGIVAVHAEAFDCRENDAGGTVQEADGILTNARGLSIGIFVADCVPVFLYDPVVRAGGIVHAGRRGTMLGIAARAVETLQEEWGSSPEDVHAVIGPSAGPSRYEVSEEVASEWAARGLPRRGRLLDLWEANAGLLAGAGVARERIQICGLCTMSGDRFFSYRRGDELARNMALWAL